MKNIKKIFFIITYLKKNISFYYIVFLSFLSSIFEIIGIGMVIPIIGIILDPINIINKIPLEFLRSILLSNSDHLLFIALLSLGSFFIIKSSFLYYAISSTYKFGFDTDSNLKNILLKKYLNLNYSFHLRRSSANLITTINKESSNVISNYLLNLTTLISEGFILILIILFLFIIDTSLTFFTITFLFISVLIFLRINKSKLEKYGQERIRYEEVNLINIQDIFGAVKEIKIFLSSNFFVNKNLESLKKLNFFNRKYLTYQQLPRIFLEVICLISFSCIIGYMKFKGYSVIKIVSILGVYLASIFRLLPSLNRIMYAYQGLTYSSSSLDIIHNDLISFNEELEEITEKEFEITFNDKIIINNLDYINSLSKKYILKKINLEIKKNSKIGIYGESGVGKSTLINIILSLLKPSSGSITVDGKDIFTNILAWRKIVSYVSQTPYIFRDTLELNIAIGKSLEEIDRKIIKEVVHYSELESLSDELLLRSKNHLGDRGAGISGGQAQRVAIARALYKQADIIIFDEATSSLDVQTEEKIVNKIFELFNKKTLIFITHKLSTIKNCDQIYELTKEGLILKK
jgi:ABC-type multidrug transport system fused ATPase/permease subunit